MYSHCVVSAKVETFFCLIQTRGKIAKVIFNIKSSPRLEILLQRVRAFKFL